MIATALIGFGLTCVFPAEASASSACEKLQVYLDLVQTARDEAEAYQEENNADMEAVAEQERVHEMDLAAEYQGRCDDARLRQKYYIYVLLDDLYKLGNEPTPENVIGLDLDLLNFRSLGGAQSNPIVYATYKQALKDICATVGLVYVSPDTGDTVRVKHPHPAPTTNPTVDASVDSAVVASENKMAAEDVAGTAMHEEARVTEDATSATFIYTIDDTDWQKAAQRMAQDARARAALDQLTASYVTLSTSIYNDAHDGPRTKSIVVRILNMSGKLLWTTTVKPDT